MSQELLKQWPEANAAMVNRWLEAKGACVQY